MKIRIRKTSFVYRNTFVWLAPYLLFLIIFNNLAAWALIDLTGLNWVPPFHLYFDMRLFQQEFPGKWVVFPAAGLALIEHLVLDSFFEAAE